MTELEAIQLVESQQRGLDIDFQMELSSAERTIVEYTKNRDQPGLVEDRIAWIVVLSCSWGFVEVHVDDKTGNILSVKRSA
jgi:hypothetical protein